MFSCDLVAPFDIGYCAGDFEDTIVSAGGQAQAVHGRLHQGLAVRVDLAVFADVPRLHVRVGIDSVAFEPLLLDGAGAGHALADVRRRFAEAYRRISR
jgi:hypothetical protein